MSDKIRVYACFNYFPTHSFEEIIDMCKSALEAQKSGEWQDLKFEFDEDTSEWYIKGYRWETDQEYERRTKWEKSRSLSKILREVEEENEKKEYKRLKKKYGDK